MHVPAQVAPPEAATWQVALDVLNSYQRLGREVVVEGEGGLDHFAPLQAASVKMKRVKKMNKHKHRKRLKLNRHKK
jgi:hypothetical protein